MDDYLVSNLNNFQPTPHSKLKVISCNLPYDKYIRKNKLDEKHFPNSGMDSESMSSSSSDTSLNTSKISGSNSPSLTKKRKSASQTLRWTSVLHELGVKSTSRKKANRMSTEKLWSIWKKEQSALLPGAAAPNLCIKESMCPENGPNSNTPLSSEGSIVSTENLARGFISDGYNLTTWISDTFNFDVPLLDFDDFSDPSKKLDGKLKSWTRCSLI